MYRHAHWLYRCNWAVGGAGVALCWCPNEASDVELGGGLQQLGDATTSEATSVQNSEVKRTDVSCVT